VISPSVLAHDNQKSGDYADPSTCTYLYYPCIYCEKKFRLVELDNNFAAGGDQELPSSVGSGWLNISIDDPERDRRILRNNIMQELCSTPEPSGVSVANIPTIQAFDEKFIQRFLKSFERETHYIERLPNGIIRLTDEGRVHCRDFT
jgi:hypothetical protein